MCYKCVTKEHTILFCKSLFVFFRMILHITRPPGIFLSYPTPVYISFMLLFSHALFYDILIMLLPSIWQQKGGTATSLGLCTVKMQKGSPRYSQYRGLSLVLDTYFVLCLWQLYHMHFLFAIYSIYFFNVLRFKSVTVHSVRSNLVKMHSKSPSVMAFCPVCLGILPYSWQNTSRDITCEQLRYYN